MWRLIFLSVFFGLVTGCMANDSLARRDKFIDWYSCLNTQKLIHCS